MIKKNAQRRGHPDRMHRTLRRRVLIAGAAVLLSVGLTVAGAGAASASQTDFAECPVNRPNVGCGVNATVGPGSHTVVYNYRRTGGSYGNEIQVGSCQQNFCEVHSVGFPRPDWIPANFALTSDTTVNVDKAYGIPA